MLREQGPQSSAVLPTVSTSPSTHGLSPFQLFPGHCRLVTTEFVKHATFVKRFRMYGHGVLFSLVRVAKGIYNGKLLLHMYSGSDHHCSMTFGIQSETLGLKQGWKPHQSRKSCLSWICTNPSNLTLYPQNGSKKNRILYRGT